MLVITSQDTAWYLENKSIRHRWRQLFLISVLVTNAPGLLFLYITPRPRLASIFPLSYYCLRYKLCSQEERVQALFDTVGLHDIMILAMCSMTALYVWNQCVNWEFYEHGVGRERLIYIDPAWYTWGLDYHVKTVVLCFRVWDGLAKVWELTLAILGEVRHGRLTSTRVLNTGLRLGEYVLGGSLMCIALSYLTSLLGSGTVFAVVLYSVIRYIVVSVSLDRSRLQMVSK